MKGKVYLVGAGPGDPELLTLKAHRILRQAEVVLHEELVGPEILSLIPPSAQIANVGKRCGKRTISQAEIHSRMILYATQGRTVVRLKGGDPLIFGRAGEEMDALRQARVAFEVVPGITAASAAAASAQIPLTDRRSAANVVFVSNHRCPRNVGPLDGKVVSGDTTVVVYMPGTNYGQLARKLLGSGFHPATPCLVVSCVTWQQQKIQPSRLASLTDIAGIAPPTLVIVGSVARAYRHTTREDSAATEPASSTAGAPR